MLIKIKGTKRGSFFEISNITLEITTHEVQDEPWPYIFWLSIMRTVESSWYYIQRRRLCLPYQPPNPIPYKKYKQQQTNEHYTNIVHPCGTSNNTSWNIWESSTLLIECLSVSSLLVCQPTLCLHLPQCSELTCCCLIILCYGKLFIKKNLLLTMWVIFQKMKTFHFQIIIWILNDMKER